MPFFKFRRSDASSGPSSGFGAQVESVEVIRTRARHRLIGAAVLVALGVVGFPLLFDTQPRPMQVDIPIEIPSKSSVKPLFIPAPAVPSADKKISAVVSVQPKEEELAPVAPAASVAPAPPVVKKEAKPEPRPEVKPEPRREAKPETRAEEKIEARPAPKPEAKPARKPAEAQVAGARPEAGIPPLAKPAAEGKGRSVVQVGAFSDNGKVDETRAKLERAGLKTYTQVIDTKDGKRIRVRVGPFATKAEAEKAGSKIRSLDLPVAILTF